MSVRVFVRRNAAGSAQTSLSFQPDEGMKRFLDRAGKAVGVRAKRVFLDTGAEVEGTHEIQPDDDLYISAGEPFFRAAAAPSRSGPSSSSSSSSSSAAASASASSAAASTAAAARSKRLHVAVLGAGGVGKSALTLRFARNFFTPKWEPTIEDAFRKTIDVDGRACELEIVDTAGQDDFEALRPQWMMEKDGYIFVFSQDSAESLRSLRAFYELHQQVNEGAKLPIIMAANKKDIVDENPRLRQVPLEDARRVAAEYGATLMETSARSGEGVTECFETFIREVRRLREGEAKPPPPPPKKSSWCAIL